MQHPAETSICRENIWLQDLGLRSTESEQRAWAPDDDKLEKVLVCMKRFYSIMFFLFFFSCHRIWRKKQSRMNFKSSCLLWHFCPRSCVLGMMLLSTIWRTQATIWQRGCHIVWLFIGQFSNLSDPMLWSQRKKCSEHGGIQSSSWPMLICTEHCIQYCFDLFPLQNTHAQKQ